MEAVTTDTVVFVVLIGDGIHICFAGHGLVERSVEHSDHGNITHDILAGFDAGNVGGVMQGRKGDAFLNGGHDAVIDKHGVGKLLAAMNHTVADCVDFLHGGNNAVLLAGQLLNDSGNRLRVGGHGKVFVEDALAANQRAVLEVAVDTDALAKALGHDLLSLHVNQLILERGTAGVDNQNFHVSFPFYCN